MQDVKPVDISEWKTECCKTK